MKKNILAIDIGFSTITSAIATLDDNNKSKILGYGDIKSRGIDKGIIKDMNLAVKSISESIDTAKQERKQDSIDIDKTIVSISGSTKSLQSVGTVSIPNSYVSENEINLVLNNALHKAEIDSDYEPIHIIANSFKLDEQDNIQNPLGMSGAKLIANVYIVTTKKSILATLKTVLKNSGITNQSNISFVLAGYMSALSVTTIDQREAGITVLTLGGSLSTITTIKDNNLIYEQYVPVGSNNVTKDLSIMLQTSNEQAEALKVSEYMSLFTKDENVDGSNTLEVTSMVDSNITQNINISTIKNIAHARIEETLYLLNKHIKNNKLLEDIHGGIILTGGLSLIKGVTELSRKVFSPIQINNKLPMEIDNTFVKLSNARMSTITGMIIYSFDLNPKFELNSNKRLRSMNEQDINFQSKPLRHNDFPEKIKSGTKSESKNIDMSNLGKLEDNKSNSILTKTVNIFKRVF